MKIYLAAPYGARAVVASRARELERNGLTVTCSWLAETHDITPGTQGPASELPDAVVGAHAQKDFEEVRDCDLLILFTAASVGVEGGGGRHVETGMAIALNKPVLVVGEPENVFHRISPHRVLTFPDWARVRDHLVERHKLDTAIAALRGARS